MNRLQTYQVFPDIPKPLSFLIKLSRNLWWCWHLDAIELFRRIDPLLWNRSGRNPIVFSTLIPQGRLVELAKDESFLAHQERVKTVFEKQVTAPTDFSDSKYGHDDIIAYFSMEFGIHESIPLFSGGLGVLSGDHLKAASDTGLPITGVGLLYRRGYFHQFLDQIGMQQEEYPETDIYYLPVERVKDPSGNEVQISVTGPDGEIRAVVWKLMVGRIPLYLLDTNLPENPPAIREITSKLYSGGHKMRLAQEILLGIGGMRALAAMGINPTVCHMNEGHCAFASLERLALTMSSHHVDLKTALEFVPRTTVFTTHTPVAAGHDEFPVEIVKPYFFPFEEKLGTTADKILSWGQPEGSGPNGPVSMFVLGMRMSQYRNGVSRLHGSVARRMWSHVWPGRPEDEVPITHITNGVHISSWISVENALLFERYLGPQWYQHLRKKDIAGRIDKIYDEELWRAHEMSRSRLIRTCRALLVKQYARRNAPSAVVEEAKSALDQEILTIAFARRFATYKRADLIFSDPDRLEAIITSQKHPVQFIFSGKAHPKDNEGKELIKRLIEFSRGLKVRNKIVFLEDYDINIARHLVQGADVWLNTPRRPFEACGTSGIKAAANGVLNLSILDGWWCEGYTEERGWRIGNGEEYDDHQYQDAVESRALYNILENDIIPCFYERKNGDAPGRWIAMMKESMKMVIQSFCADLMVEKYGEKFYLPATEQYRLLLENNAQLSKNHFAQRKRLGSLWKNIKIEQPARTTDRTFRVGDTFRVTTKVTLGELRPEEVDVELYYKNLKTGDPLAASKTRLMTMEEDLGNGEYLYTCDLTCDHSGRFGFTARITPHGDDRIKFTPRFLTWA